MVTTLYDFSGSPLKDSRLLRAFLGATSARAHHPFVEGKFETLTVDRTPSPYCVKAVNVFGFDADRGAHSRDPIRQVLCRLPLSFASIQNGHLIDKDAVLS